MLAAWTASPARFREDANAEEDLVLGGYRDRVVVELAQNAADAAARAGVAGRLLLRLDSRDGGTVRAANTGAPLDADGVESLSTLRASAKRDDSGAVGRFGVGFAAVLAVSEAPSIVSRTGAVRWSRADAIAAVEAIPSLEPEVARRGAAVPVLRLPYDAAPQSVPDGYESEVVLPLRDGVAVELVRELLDGVGASLLLSLPALAEVIVEVDGDRRELRSEWDGDGAVVIDDVRWRVVRESGPLDAALLAARPVEERAQRAWSVTWAVPVSASGEALPLPPAVPAVVHAPTPTDEPLGLPALLIATLPLDPSRRHVAPGALRDVVVAGAAGGYVSLLRSLPATPGIVSLLPSGLAAGEVDAALRQQFGETLPGTAFLPAADASLADMRLRPREAIVFDDDELVPVMASVLPGLLPPGWRSGALTALGVRRWSASDVVAALAGLERDPSWWRELYGALADAAADRDALAGLPVPLAGGGLAGSPRGLVLAGGFDVDLAPLGLRAVHPGAAHPLLLRCGAVEADPHALLDDARVQAAVAESFDADDPAPIADAVLAVVAAAGVRPGALPWLAELALPGEDGEIYPAGELLLPDSPLRTLVADDAPFGVVAGELVDRWSASTLAAVGVLRSFAVVRADDVANAELDLDGEDEYLDFVTSVAGDDGGEPVVVTELAGVRDLELVRGDAWPTVLALLAEPPLRAVVIEPAVVARGARRVRVPSYTAWWLREHGVVVGLAPGADPLLDGLYEPVADGLDAEFLVAAGAMRHLDDADPDDVLARLADPAREVSREQVKALYAWAEPVHSPSRVRAVRDGALVVVDPADAVVVDAPDLLPLLGSRAYVPVSAADAERIADALDVRLASRVATFAVLSTGRSDGDHVVHEPLEVANADGKPVRVPWRLTDGELHVDAGRLAHGLGRGRAWRARDWGRRHLLTEIVRGDVPEAVLSAESDLD